MDLGEINTLFNDPTLTSGGDGDALDRLARVVAQPHRVDTVTVDYLTQVLAQQRRVEDVLGAARVLPLVLPTVELVEALASDARPNIRPNVLRLLGEYRQFSGWMSEDSSDDGGAVLHYDRALDAAAESGDVNMISSVWSLKSHLAWSQGDPGKAVGLAQAGQRHAGKTSPGVESLIVQQEARGHAMRGEARDVERLLARSEDLASRAAEHPECEPPWVYFAGTDRVLFQRGTAYLELGDYRRAAEMFERARIELPPGYRRDLARYTANVALAAAHLGDVARAVTESVRAVPLAIETASATAVAALRRMRAALGDHESEPRVAQFDALVSDFAS